MELEQNYRISSLFRGWVTDLALFKMFCGSGQFVQIVNTCHTVLRIKQFRIFSVPIYFCTEVNWKPNTFRIVLLRNYKTENTFFLSMCYLLVLQMIKKNMGGNIDPSLSIYQEKWLSQYIGHKSLCLPTSR